MFKRGYTISRKPKPISQLIKKGYTALHHRNSGDVKQKGQQLRHGRDLDTSTYDTISEVAKQHLRSNVLPLNKE